MNDQNSSNHSNNSLDDILKELEERFGINTDSDKKEDSKQNKGSSFKRYSQNQILGGLTLVLLVVGAVAGVYLGQTNQELRQRAQVDPYAVCPDNQTCVATAFDCSNQGGSVTGPCTGQSGFCCLPPTQPTATPISACLCGVNSDSQCVGKGVNSACTIGGTASNCGASNLRDENGNYFCSCGSPINPSCPGGPAPTATRTRTPTPGGPTSVPPTNTPVPPTVVPPTNTPGGPTQPPTTPTRTPTRTPTYTPTRTPTRTPTGTITPTVTPPGPSCNGIAVTYGAPTDNRPVKIGDVISLTCGPIATAFRYEFRLFLNGVFLQDIAPISTSASVSQPFTIAQSGNYSAQCRICTDSSAASCQNWETLP